MTETRGAAQPFRLALRSPFPSGGLPVRFRAGFLVSIRADGHTGWGEASPLPGWSHNTLLDTETALRRALARLDAGGEAALEALIQSLDGAPHARAAMAGAWADLQARRTGRTLADHLVQSVDGDRARGAGGGRAETSGTGRAGPAPAAAVAVNALVTAVEPDDVETEAHDAVEAGFGAVKLKVGRAEPAEDLDRVRAARAGLGPGAELRLDANGAWDEATAVGVLRQAEACDIAFCEEPVAGIEAIAAVGRRVPASVAVDESMRDEADAVRALERGVGFLVIKPQALGGPDVALAIAARAREAGAAAVVTSFLDSAVGLAHALHVAAAVDAAAGRRRAHGLATAGLLSHDVAQPPAVVSGAMGLPSAPGLGLAPDSGPGT